MDLSVNSNFPVPETDLGRTRTATPATGRTPAYRRDGRGDTLASVFGQDLDRGSQTEEHATVGTGEHTERDIEPALPVTTGGAPEPAEAPHPYHDVPGPSPVVSQPTPVLTESLPPLEAVASGPHPPHAFERVTSFMIAALLDAAAQTLEWMGLTRLRRLPGALALFGILFFFFGLPQGWVEAGFGGRVFELADWGPAVALRALVVQFSATFAVRLVLARPRVRRARTEVPSQTRRRLIERADELLAAPVSNAQELKFWVEQHDIWLREATADIAESHSKAAAEGLQAVTPDDEPVLFHHAHDPVHNGWLNLLAHRIEFLNRLTDDDG
ncbi:MAG: hypothetical protein ACYTG2_07850 [Planctomycetota bacterium]